MAIIQDQQIKLFHFKKIFLNSLKEDEVSHNKHLTFLQLSCPSRMRNNDVVGKPSNSNMLRYTSDGPTVIHLFSHEKFPPSKECGGVNKQIAEVLI